MATKNDHVTESIMKEVMQTMEKYYPEEFDFLNENPEEKQEFLKTARASAVEAVKIGADAELCSEDNIKEHLAKYLPDDRIALIEEGFTIPTYQIDISKKVDEVHYADFIRDGRPVFAQKKLDNETSIIAASNIQIASIVVESVLFVMNAAGVKPSVSAYVVTKVAKSILSVCEKDAGIQKRVKEAREAVKGGSKKCIALALIRLLKAVNNAGILWNTIKELCKSMSHWQWLKTLATLTATIVAAFGTAGAALIGHIILGLKAAYDLYKKFRNLDTLEAIQY